MLAYRKLEDAILHEAGHGLGNVAQHNLYIVDWAPTDTTASGELRWVGPTAMSAYEGLGGSGSVPLTRDWTHWSTSIGNDVTQSMANPQFRLSALSVGALMDLGYDARVDMVEPVVPIVHPHLRVE